MNHGSVTHVSLFTGIGGIDLAAEWAGFTTIAQVERDPYCLAVLAKHWPDVLRCDDIHKFPDRDYGAVTLISGGFPCQDISISGPRVGLDGARSSLWFEYLRVIGEIRPAYALVENVGALTFWGLGEILGGLTEIGYDSEWQNLRASDFGAPHKRERTWIVAYPSGVGFQEPRLKMREGAVESFSCPTQSWPPRFTALADIPRRTDGIPHRMDRLRALGNAVVPQQVYPILRAIAETEQGKVKK